MRNFLLAALVVFAALALAAVVIVSLTVRALRRRLRVVPRARSGAPIAWLWSPVPAARLHRRLRTAAAVARATGERSDLAGWVGAEFPALVRRIEAEAVQLDGDLVRAGRSPATVRRRMLPDVETRVAELEGTVGLLLETATDWSACTGLVEARALRQVDERLEAMRAAAEEITVIDARGPAEPGEGATSGVRPLAFH